MLNKELKKVTLKKLFLYTKDYFTNLQKKQTAFVVPKKVRQKNLTFRCFTWLSVFIYSLSSITSITFINLVKLERSLSAKVRSI